MTAAGWNTLNEDCLYLENTCWVAQKKMNVGKCKVQETEEEGRDVSHSVEYVLNLNEHFIINQNNILKMAV